VAAIYARENGHGMSFETGRKETAWEASGDALSKEGPAAPEPPSAPGGGKPNLRVVK
jgi:stringent starvation protein B